MNLSKFITTVLITAWYTSSWWIVNGFGCDNADGFIEIAAALTAIFGSLGLIIGGVIWLTFNWDK